VASGDYRYRRRAPAGEPLGQRLGVFSANLGRALASKGQYEAAISKYQEALRGAPNRQEIQSHLAKAQLELAELNKVRQKKK
jgi:tetratricopeptide (TPR) repeat protein